MVEVVAALLLRTQNKRTELLICRRPANKARGLLWEFVGGKIEPGEALRQALARECREELGVSVCVGLPYLTVVHEYPDLTVRLSLYQAVLPAGETPKKLEHDELRWIMPEEIPQFEFCPADQIILEKIQREGLPKISELQKELLFMQDLSYRKFQISLIPTVNPETVIGIRTPVLRAFAKRFAKSNEATAFLRDLPHTYFEEKNLHAFLIEQMGDYAQTIAALDAFLPYVDNWATCDSLSPKCFQKHRPELRKEIDRWLCSPHTYVVRFAIKTLMTEFLGDDFLPTDPERLAAYQTGEYYLQMMIAWYFATALAKRPDDIFPYFRTGVLNPAVRKMAVRKAKDSFRIPKEKKELFNHI